METEGAYYADVSIRDAIKQGVIPGPRMLVVTRALDVTGAYAIVGYDPAWNLPHGVQVVDGPDECRKAVREQIGNGADWIKVYADQRVSTADVVHSIPTFTPEELHAIVDEAHREITRWRRTPWGWKVCTTRWRRAWIPSSTAPTSPTMT